MNASTNLNVTSACNQCILITHLRNFLVELCVVVTHVQYLPTVGENGMYMTAYQTNKKIVRQKKTYKSSDPGIKKIFV